MKLLYFLMSFTLLALSGSVFADQNNTRNDVIINKVSVGDTTVQNNDNSGLMYPLDASDIVVKQVTINPNAAPETKKLFYQRSGGSDTLTLFFNSRGVQLDPKESIRLLDEQKAKDEMMLKEMEKEAEKKTNNNPKR